MRKTAGKPAGAAGAAGVTETEGGAVGAYQNNMMCFYINQCHSVFYVTKDEEIFSPYKYLWLKIL